MSVNSDAKRQLQNRAVFGICLMIFGLALYPLSDAFIKHLMGTYSVPQTSFLRAATRLPPLLIMMFFQGGIRKVLGTRHPKQHLIRLFVNLIYTLTFMYAFSMASLTTTYTISYTSSLFMIILSALILKESVTWDRWAAVGIGLLGVMIAMRPWTGVFEMVALVVLFGTFLGALNKILMRKLASTEHSLAIAIYPNLVMILAMTPFLFSSFVPWDGWGPWKAMPWEHWGLFAIVGIITAAGQYAIAQALRFAQGSALAPIDYSTYFWVVAFDAFWWHKIPDLYMILGAAVIVGSNLYILYRSSQEKRIPKASQAT
ncbi:MAG: DMT family transporter [Simkaniaceae bacterium]|nr:MAG: DMT family transporter [Simkaniaceae bacterium]